VTSGRLTPLVIVRLAGRYLKDLQSLWFAVGILDVDSTAGVHQFIEVVVDLQGAVDGLCFGVAGALHRGFEGVPRPWGQVDGHALWCWVAAAGGDRGAVLVSHRAFCRWHLPQPFSGAVHGTGQQDRGWKAIDVPGVGEQPGRVAGLGIAVSWVVEIGSSAPGCKSSADNADIVTWIV